MKWTTIKGGKRMGILQGILKGMLSCIWLLLTAAVKLLGLSAQLLICMFVLALNVFCVMLHAASFD